MYTRDQLHTPVIMIEALYSLKGENYTQDWHTVGFCQTLYRIWEGYKPKPTLKSLLLK